MFNRILKSEQNPDIVLKMINKEASFSSINNHSTNSISNLRSRSYLVSPSHQIQRKIQKKVHDYFHKSIDNFKLIVVNLSPKLTDQVRRSIEISFWCAYEDKGIETNVQKILTRVINHCNENKSSAQPSACALTPDQTVDLKIHSIELKYYILSFYIYPESDELPVTNQMHFML